MARFLTERLLQALLVLLVMSFVVYMLIGLMPGDPIDLMIASDPNLTAADAARLKALYGLDKPVIERYFNWLVAALSGDLGYSRLAAQPTLAVVLPRMGNTAILMICTLLLALGIALPAGIYAARKPYTKLDTLVNFLCFGGISMPSFWLALLLIILFAVNLGWLPASGMAPVGSDRFADRIPYLIMPVVTLTLLNAGVLTRHIRAAMLEQLRQDYVRTARAKGVAETAVVWKHALRNGMIPIVTIVSHDIGTLFSGAVVTETIFGYLGMGKLIYDSVMGNDFNVALVALLAATAMILFANLLADIAYAALDPRVTFAARKA
jgi:peptide/nickel transport system permease protein